MYISEMVLSVISEYQQKIDLHGWWRSDDFDYICAVDYTCEYLKELIRLHPTKDPIEILETYHDLMLLYDGTNRSGRLIFQASADTADQIVQILLKGE